MTEGSRPEGPVERAVALTRALVDIPSVTGDEGPVMEFLESHLRASGWPVSRQPVQGNRFNLWCSPSRRPRVIFSTHLDTVPPFFSSREDGEFIYGRGSCDAKGIAAAMVCAASALLSEGVSDVGLLFVVGEETDSIGARTAVVSGVQGDFLVNGEPTDNALVTAHKGIVLGQLTTQGKTAHSAYPEQGISAIDRLVEWLGKLKSVSWPRDGGLGQSYFNVGRISGGEAANVVAGQARAEFLIRTVAPSRHYLRLMDESIPEGGQLEILKTTEPQQMLAVPGFPTRVVSFSTDIPALRSLARPLLIGPGSILEAHTADEKIAKQELLDGVRTYGRLARALIDADPEDFDEE